MQIHSSSTTAVNLELALSIAREAHAGQTRRHGLPYISHPIAVKTLVDDVGSACGIAVDDVARAVALMHDVVEDSEITAAEIAARFGDDVAQRVVLLTKSGKGEAATAQYYARLNAEADDALRLIKTCDRLHNLSELHLAADPAKLKNYVEETLAHVVPLAQGAKQSRGLVAALYDALRTASRAQGAPAPDAVAREKAHVPSGIYAVVHPHTIHPNAGALVDDVDELVERVRELIDGGVSLIQLRAKGRSDRDVLAMLEAILPMCRKSSLPVVVNDRPDLCVAAGADGVHVGQTDIPPLFARRIVGASALVGASSHTEADVVTVCAEGGADHVAVGPVFPSVTKSGHAEVVGVDALAVRAATSKLRVVAIGGITTPQRAAACASAGARLAAAVSALQGPDARVMCRRMSLAFVAAAASRAVTT